MEGQFRSFFEVDVELELIEIDSYGWVGIFDHFFTSQSVIEKLVISNG